MPKVTLGFAGALIAIGLFGYFGSASEHPSPTALIPAGFGIVMAACGLAGLKPEMRKHSMHVAVAVALLGALAGLGRVASKFSIMLSDDLTLSRPLRLALLMAIVCGIYVALGVRSFIAARRARLSKDAS